MIEEIPLKINNPRKAKNAEHKMSLHRVSKIGVHTTVAGKGVVSRITTPTMRKGKKARKK